MIVSAWLGILAWLTIASTAVFLVVSLLNRLLPRRAAGLRHALLALVLVRLVLPPGTTSPISMWRLFEGRMFEGRILADRSWAEQGPAPGAAAGLALRDAPRSGSSSAPSRPAARPWIRLLGAGWFLGAVLTAVWLLARRRRFHRLVARSRTVTDGWAGEAADSWRRRLALRRPVRLLACRSPVVPFTLGVVRPVVVLPEELVGSADRALVESVVAHELAHVKRLDDLWLAFQCLAQSMFFFHPIVWLTTRAMSSERELACDRLVLASGRLSPTTYGRSLLKVLGFEQTSGAVAAAVGPKRRLTMRIHQIANHRPAGRAHALLSLALIALLASSLLPMAATGEQPVPATEPPKYLAAAPPSSALPNLNPLALLTAEINRPTLDDLMPGAKMTSGFGLRRHPIDGNMAHHDGVDLSTGKQSPVYVPRGGVVEVAEAGYGAQGKMGKVVIVDHGGGVKTFYAHLARITVKAGQGVTDGDQIGYAGNTGVSAGPHLHFEIWKDGEKIDPVRIAEVVGGC